jgi:hypothetical protein
VSVRRALGRGGVVAAACVACCASPIIAALGVTAGLAATAAIFAGLATAVAVVLIGAGWVFARTRRPRRAGECDTTAGSVAVAAPTRREAP